MDDDRAEVLAFAVFPRAHWTKIWSTNPLERLNNQVKRRALEVGISPTNPRCLPPRNTDHIAAFRRQAPRTTSKPTTPQVPPTLAGAAYVGDSFWNTTERHLLLPSRGCHHPNHRHPLGGCRILPRRRSLDDPCPARRVLTRMDEVELSILAAPSDMPYLPRTLDHQLRAFADSSSIVRRVLVLDQPTSPSVESAEALRRLAGDLLTGGHVDEVRMVDWSTEVVSQAMERWFGDRETPPWIGRRARYQYVYSFESARAPLVLHLDSDVLFYGRMGMWLDRVVDVFARDSDAIAVIPNAAVPQATRLTEWLLGPRVDRPRWPPGWSVGTGVTSRGLLVHRERLFSRALPLNGNEDEQWEASLAAALAEKRLHVHSLLGTTHGCCTHTSTMRLTYAGSATLIAEVEAGGYPYRRFGHPWDITTEGWKFWPWLPRLALRRLRSRTLVTGSRRH